MNKELKNEILDKILKDEPSSAFEDPFDKLIQIALKIYHLDEYAAEIRKDNKMTEAKKSEIMDNMIALTIKLNKYASEINLKPAEKSASYKTKHNKNCKEN